MKHQLEHSKELLLLPQLGFGCAEDAVCLLHFRPAVAGVVHLQAVIQLVQVFLHLLDLLS